MRKAAFAAFACAFVVLSACSLVAGLSDYGPGLDEGADAGDAGDARAVEDQRAQHPDAQHQDADDASDAATSDGDGN